MEVAVEFEILRNEREKVVGLGRGGDFAQAREEIVVVVERLPAGIRRERHQHFGLAALAVEAAVWCENPRRPEFGSFVAWLISPRSGTYSPRASSVLMKTL